MVVRHDAAPALVESSHQTYALIEPHVGDADLAVRVVRPVVDQALRNRGYTPAAQDGADLIVSYKVVTASGETGAGNADEPSHQKTVFVLLQDAETLDILWLGWSQDEVKESELEERTGEAARRIVDSLPARGNSRG